MMEFVYPHTHLVAGVDEVGRGPLVGAVVTAAVILDPAKPILGLADSIDGNRCPPLPVPSLAVVKGDSRVAEISAASILAKVTRDAEMAVLDREFPQYGFAQHKGYPTAFHLQKLLEHGVIEQYRRSFGPVKRALGLAS